VFSKSVAARVFRDLCNAIADGVDMVASQNNAEDNSLVNVKPEVADKAVGSKECPSDVTKSRTTRRRRRESGERSIPQQDVVDDALTAAKSKVEKKGMEVAAKQKSSGDKDLSIDERIKAAENGDVGAQLNLALMYGLRNDNVTAAKWYRKAAELGDAKAQFELGRCYAKGKGVSKSMEEAAAWYRKASDQGLAVAQWSLGSCYRQGAGVSKNATEGAKWLKEAALQGLGVAQLHLGLCYASGEGVSRDVIEAARWYQKAAVQDIAEAQYQLGLIYMGYGVSANDKREAIKWLRKASAQGHEEAQEFLAEILRRL
jgi:TPR repeat protein